MSCNYLIDQALKRIWSSPRQDVQSIVKPKRISRENGVWNSVDVLYDRYVLPLKNTKFHVYQVGQLYPTLLGLFPKQDEWMTLADNSTRLKMHVNVYSDKGIEMPRLTTWYLVTPDRNLLLAVKVQDHIDIDLDKEPLYLRVYSGAWFKGDFINDMNEYVRVGGGEVKTVSDGAVLKSTYESLRKAGLGVPLLYVNGRKTDTFKVADLRIGDVVEWVEDTSVYRYVEFPVLGLPTFDSIRDSMRKYLLHYQLPKGLSVDLEYHDDVDFYVVRKDPSGATQHYTGFYYHRNREESVRNVTHRDYSLSTEYVGQYTKQDLPQWSEDKSLTGWTVQVYIRKNGFTGKGTSFVHNRVKELYKLPDVYIVRALTGIDSVVPEWTAANLENSAYTRVMGWLDYNLDAKMVEDAFGYNAISVMVGDTPSKVTTFSGQRVVELPLVLRRYSTGFEYDGNGLLIGYHSHLEGDRYVVRDNRTQLVEMLGGYGSEFLDESYNREYSHWAPEFNYRLYRREKGSTQWVDVSDTDVYLLDKKNKRFRWLHDMSAYDCVVRSDKNILVQTENLVMRDGVLVVPMTYLSNRSGIATRHLLEFPSREVDVFLNGYSLVEGVDYYVDGTRVCIVNKKHLKQPANTETQRVVIRSYGFTGKDFKREEKDDVGFVRYGRLSRNNRFDLRDDRVMRMTVGGRLIHRDDLVYSEEDTESVGVAGVYEGQPYEVKDLLVPLRSLVTQEHYAFRERSREVDKRVSEYMTRLMKDTPKQNAVAIPSLWPVMSPFFNRVLFDFINGSRKLSDLPSHYDDDYLREYLKEYTYLLRVDPTQDSVRADPEFVKVYPSILDTVISVEYQLYQFLERVNRIFLQERLDLTPFFKIN